MTLYEIDQALLACIDMETGEVDIEKYEQLAEEKDKKIENIACYYKALTAEAEAIKAEEKALAERRKAKENKAESLKKFLASVLNGEKFESARCSVSWRKTQAAEITDEKAAIAWLMAHGHDEAVKYPAPTIDKTVLKKIIKGGEAVPGAEVKDSLSMGVK